MFNTSTQKVGPGEERGSKLDERYVTRQSLLMVVVGVCVCLTVYMRKGFRFGVFVFSKYSVFTSK